MIERFPLPLNNFWAVVLSSALATRIDWSTPFQTDDAAVFRSGWRDDVRSVLRTPERGHHCAIARHPEAGDVAVHRAWAEGLHVTSVIAAPEVPAATVLAAAHDAARVRGHRLTPYALVDLPLGDGIAWTIANVRGQGSAERFAAVLPAWSATSEHDLGAAPFGFAAAARVLERLGYGDQWDARQAPWRATTAPVSPRPRSRRWPSRSASPSAAASSARRCCASTGPTRWWPRPPDRERGRSCPSSRPG